MKSKKPLISIVIPAYNEEKNIPILVERIKETIGKESAFDFEIIIVDDGSTDNTWGAIKRLAKKDRRIKGIRLLYNSGQQAAIISGIKYARGDAIITMDADLQHPPEIIPELVKYWRKGFDVVQVVGRPKKEKTLKRVLSQLYYRIYKIFTGIPLPKNAPEFRLIDSKIAKHLATSIRPRAVLLRAAVAKTTPKEKIKIIETTFGERKYGTTKYTFSRMLDLGLAGILLYTKNPLRIFAYISVIAALVGILAAIVAVWGYLHGTVVPGWTSSVLISSIILFITGTGFAMVGEYVSRIYELVANTKDLEVGDTVNVEH